MVGKVVVRLTWLRRNTSGGKASKADCFANISLTENPTVAAAASMAVVRYENMVEQASKPNSGFWHVNIRHERCEFCTARDNLKTHQQ
ncbi:hypothetical protein HBI56_029010 [Parastagonospora nodorum]|nr:hypothetical protein HBH56_016620 [Parastagonospora nodorum]KAH3937106.1 hypothetical protein HBH54_017840 [Parastagonospora nodorum]KAH3953705.1 hypothetical protein HBH53_030220 [Parastagonospora nodorum]KAH3969456.1 hypothetical protein HBH51_122370 [Parastagonospora nodorum]KAH3990750.1 hypothetical protein HBH52_007210 [Parastagonospora nodorum]